MKYGVLLPKRAKWTWLFLGYTYLLFTKRSLLLGCREKFIFLYIHVYKFKADLVDCLLTTQPP